MLLADQGQSWKEEVEAALVDTLNDGAEALHCSAASSSSSSVTAAGLECSAGAGEAPLAR
ncbi:hypothetical protein MC885_007068 [Smutsia gigantea]|nr:hypothetical protein MC885_007068 [Smutsia gigantea]